MPVASSTFHWTEAYSVHIAVLDEQHQKLFDAVNELDQALRRGEGNSAIDPILKKLVEYSVVHFTAEEALMKEHDFPGLPTHKTQHQLFRQKLAVYVEDHKTGKAGVPVSLLFFLQDWLKKHVLKTDKQYSAYLNSRGVH